MSYFVRELKVERLLVGVTPLVARQYQARLR